MQLGVSTASFFLQTTTENSFDLMRELGLDVCEIFMSTYREYEEDFGFLMKEKLGNINVHSIHSLNTQFEPQLFNHAFRTRDDAEMIFRKVLRNGQIVGAKNYTFHGQIKLKKTTKFDNDSIGQRAVQLQAIAKEYGIEFCYENVHWSHFSSPEFLTDILKFAPTMKTCLDIKQARQSGIGWRKYLEVMKGRLNTVHICDVDNFGNTKNFGCGTFDFDEFFSALNDAGYQGPVIAELYSKDYKDFADLKNGIDFIREKMAKYNK